MKRIRDPVFLEPAYDGVLPLDLLREICARLDGITQRSLIDSCRYLHVPDRLPRLPLFFAISYGTDTDKLRRRSIKALATYASLALLEEVLPYIREHYIIRQLFYYFIGRAGRTDINWKAFRMDVNKEELFLGQIRHAVVPVEKSGFRLLGIFIYKLIVHEVLRRPDAMVRLAPAVAWLWKSYERKVPDTSHDRFLCNNVLPECIESDRFFPMAMTIPAIDQVSGYFVPSGPNYQWIMWCMTHSNIWPRGNPYYYTFVREEIPEEFALFLEKHSIPFKKINTV